MGVNKLVDCIYLCLHEFQRKVSTQRLHTQFRINHTKSKNTESGDPNQRIPNQEIQIKQYRIMVSVKWGNRTLQLVICSFRVVWGHYVSQDLHLGILTRLWCIFLWTFCKELCHVYKVHLTLCLFRCGLCDTGDFLVCSTDLGPSFMHFFNWKGKLVAKPGGNKEIQPNPSQATLTCSYITQQGLWARARPSEPPSSAAEQPSPAVT